MLTTSDTKLIFHWDGFSCFQMVFQDFQDFKGVFMSSRNAGGGWLNFAQARRPKNLKPISALRKKWGELGVRWGKTQLWKWGAAFKKNGGRLPDFLFGGIIDVKKLDANDIQLLREVFLPKRWTSNWRGVLYVSSGKLTTPKILGINSSHPWGGNPEKMGI